MGFGAWQTTWRNSNSIAAFLAMYRDRIMAKAIYAGGLQMGQ
jgi:hypothetical protein